MYLTCGAQLEDATSGVKRLKEAERCGGAVGVDVSAKSLSVIREVRGATSWRNRVCIAPPDWLTSLNGKLSYTLTRKC
eukprot:scaffold581_cov263-Pinguiococcus_pyrenoidosus.AAC.8